MNKYFILAHQNAKRIKYRKNKRQAARTICKQLIAGLEQNMAAGAK